MRPFAGKRVLLGVTGGIAAYKAITVARRLTQHGATVDVVLTAGALEFLTPLTFEGVTGRPAHSTPYTPGDPLLHIRLARESDLILVAPATANLIARAAAGMADDLLTCVLLATEAPVLVCPAMNDRMYAHPQTTRNLAHLQELGYELAGPGIGPLAWGEGEGPGRLLEPEEILDHAGRILETPDLAGRRILVTAGPTREYLDPVRYLGNRSSGRMGYAVAAAAWRRGAEVVLIAGPGTAPVPRGPRLVRVETAEEMASAVNRELPSAEALVMAAAVADFRPTRRSEAKIKKGSGTVPELTLARTPDVLSDTRESRPPGCVLVGFALETDEPLANGRKKLAEKGLDLIVVNDANEAGAGFDVETNRVTLLDDTGAEELPLLSKAEVADRILDRVIPRLEGAG